MDYLLSWYSPYVSLTRGPFKLFKYKMKMKIHSFFRLVAQRGLRGVTNIMKKCIWPPPFPYQISQHEPACHDIEAVPWVSIFLRCIDTSPAARHPELETNKVLQSITEKAPTTTRVFSGLKAGTAPFTFQNLLRHYAKQASSNCK